ncbi:Adenine phosphoribosyltransferase 1 [Platanthera guangdongensis]|uniref:Adenine phosphoribosyltransferase 1 n=1 Tax=Platanthera guangdongensis TaxID=2320717 RepID=A0ABR2LVS3_9ASPA
MFQDITALLLDPIAFRDTMNLFVERYRDKQIYAAVMTLLYMGIGSVLTAWKFLSCVRPT